ncbi:hypothetical protein BGZ73_008463 [Actinomortierella ambigua]|nr:hypothetical protein BGZ73_008463 [Actinomortierella ambigua]
MAKNPTLKTFTSTWHAVKIPERIAGIPPPKMEDTQSGWQHATKFPENFADIPLPTMEDVKAGWDAIPNSAKGAAIGVAAGLAVGALGFGSTVIVAGSKATAIMSSYGGTVTSGSVCAVAQSIGAAGFSVSTYGLAGAVGGLAGDIIPTGKESRNEDSAADSFEVK